MTNKRIDIGQLSIFDLIKQVTERQSSAVTDKSSTDATVRAVVSDSLKHCPLSRWEVAGKMSEALGVEISKSQIDSWSAESKDGHRFPLIYAAAFCLASCDKSLIHYICRLSGGYFIEGEDALRLEIGKIEEQRQEHLQALGALNKKEDTIQGFLESLKRKG